MTKVTKWQAERVLAEVRKTFKPWAYNEDGSLADYGPKLVMDFDWTGSPGPAIVWEEGPFEWTYLFPGGGREDEFGTRIKAAALPKGVWTEAATSWAISIYREG